MPDELIIEEGFPVQDTHHDPEQHRRLLAEAINRVLTLMKSDYVLKAGDTMTGTLTISVTSGNALVVDVSVLVVDAENNRVGINTATPARTLDVNSDDDFMADFSGTTGGQHYIGISNTANAWTIGQSSAEEFFIRDGTAGGKILKAADGAPDTIAIDASGNVGLGGTPTEKLTVKDSGAVKVLVESEGAAAAEYQVKNTVGDWSLIVGGGGGIRLQDNGASTFPIVVQEASASNSLVVMTSSNLVRFGTGTEFGASGPTGTFGTGSPESVVTAPVGSTFHRTDGGAGTSFYVKETGTGNTGWVGK